MGIEKFFKGNISPMEVNKEGQKVPDMTPEEAAQASARLEADETEAARKLLEETANEKKSQEDRQKEINDILKNLK